MYVCQKVYEGDACKMKINSSIILAKIRSRNSSGEGEGGEGGHGMSRKNGNTTPESDEEVR